MGTCCGGAKAAKEAKQGDIIESKPIIKKPRGFSIDIKSEGLKLSESDAKTCESSQAEENSISKTKKPSESR